ncbi:MAG: tolB [Solirubrobacterales bacterium]|nr:tolB [Solirubrobacterales bacterium]
MRALRTRYGRLATPALVLALAGVTALVGLAAATPPGTNGRITWQREPATPNGFPHLWTANPDGSDARQPFSAVPNRGDIEGTFSPTDANVMFFTRFAPSPFAADLYRGDLATGAVTRVTRAQSADIAPTVSPDGTKLAYFAVPRPRHINLDRPPPPERIRVANLDGSGGRMLTARRLRSIDPDWSPDGRRIVYAERRFVKGREAAQIRLVVMNADGTGRRAITAFGDRDELNPKWMPDGKTIVFERGQPRGMRSDIAAISPDGGPQRTILATGAWETNPIPSPDGTRIAFTSDRDRRGDRLGPGSGTRLGPGFEVYTMALDGSGIVRLTNNKVPDLFPDWQRLP